MGWIIFFYRLLILLRVRSSILATAQVEAEVCQTVISKPGILKDPCHEKMHQAAPTAFSIEFDIRNFQQGSIRCHCERERAPTHADRIWNLARFGYFSDNYFFRVLPNFVAQFGTSGDPSISNVYNYSTTTSECAILRPQPPNMPFCLANRDDEEDPKKTRGLTWIPRSKTKLPPSSWIKRRRAAVAKHDCTNTTGLSNTFGTLSMSTSYNQNLSEYPDGVTWNATAEIFLNLGDNGRLDKHLFVPICTIENTLLDFPSFGEVAELGGSGPSLGTLYEKGNSYIESNEEWKSSMAQVESVRVCATTT